MKSAITDDMKSQRMILRHSPRRYDFPRYGNFYSDFSTLWKIFFHSMENVGRATARTRRGRCCYQEPSPRIGDKMHNKALHRTAHKVRRPVKADGSEKKSRPVIVQQNSKTPTPIGSRACAGCREIILSARRRGAAIAECSIREPSPHSHPAHTPPTISNQHTPPMKGQSEQGVPPYGAQGAAGDR